MRTLIVSDLHLGSRLGRDVLRKDVALDRLLERADGSDRLVLLGDTVELLEGRPRQAMQEAEPVLKRIGDVMAGKPVVVLPGNHDYAWVRPWLKERRLAGKPIGLASRVPIRASSGLTRVARWLKPAQVEVRYPGAWLEDGVWAHHGHYLDRHLVKQPQLPRHEAVAEDYERALGTSIAAVGAIAATAFPPVIGEPLDKLAGLARWASMAAMPVAGSLPGAPLLAPLSAGVIGFQFRRVGLPAMEAVAARLGVEARHVLFGHVHRAGPRAGDRPTEWQSGGANLWNTGCWVYEPLLLAGGKPGHPYWPGSALELEDGRVRTLTLLDDVDPKRLR